MCEEKKTTDAESFPPVELGCGLRAHTLEWVVPDKQGAMAGLKLKYTGNPTWFPGTGGVEEHRVYGVVGECDEILWFLFYVENQMDPPLYVIRGYDFQDAYDEFLDKFPHLVSISDEDLPDYLEDTEEIDKESLIEIKGVKYPGKDFVDTLDWSEDGKPLDTELLRGYEIILVAAYF